MYRPNVAALIVNPRGELLVCERFRTPGAWQFPQGGVDEGEGMEEALLRELEEEIGLTLEHYTIETSKDGYRYDYPESVRLAKPTRKARYAGQEQTYFLCRTKEERPPLDLMKEPREFSQSKWIHPEEFQIEWLPDFKYEVYRAVMGDFFEVKI